MRSRRRLPAGIEPGYEVLASILAVHREDLQPTAAHRPWPPPAVWSSIWITVKQSQLRYLSYNYLTRILSSTLQLWTKRVQTPELRFRQNGLSTQ